MIGHVVGNYKIIEKLGEGGMGAVYKGVDLMLEREVAIKVLRPELARQPQIVERFRSEAVTLAKLNHPHIATLYSFFRQGDDFFMVIELVRGETLDDVIRRSGPMSVERAVPLFCQALEGIDHAHRLGVIHRDIKPANMMLTDAGTIKVMDFGIARVLGSSRMTRQGNLIGTIEYMSPEQVRGQETDARSDIYSLGILLYEMLTGRVPFASESEFDLMKMQIENAPQPPRYFAPHITPPVEAAILRAMAKRPEDRFQTAGELRAVLLGSVEAPASAAAPISAERSAPPTRLSAPGADLVPASGEGRAALGPADEMKATRLAGAGASSAEHGPQAKETRLGQAAGADQAPPAYYPQGGQGAQGGGALSRLTWKHYAAAAVAAIVLFFVVTVPVVVFLFSRKSAPEPAVVSQPSPAPATTPAVQPTVVTTVPSTESNVPSVSEKLPPATGPTPGGDGKLGGSDTAIDLTPRQKIGNESRQAKTTSKTTDASARDRRRAGGDDDRARRRAEALRLLDQ
jgi:serine/threonine-protein kinase